MIDDNGVTGPHLGLDRTQIRVELRESFRRDDVHNASDFEEGIESVVSHKSTDRGWICDAAGFYHHVSEVTVGVQRGDFVAHESHKVGRLAFAKQAASDDGMSGAPAHGERRAVYVLAREFVDQKQNLLVRMELGQLQQEGCLAGAQKSGDER